MLPPLNCQLCRAFQARTPKASQGSRALTKGLNMVAIACAVTFAICSTAFARPEPDFAARARATYREAHASYAKSSKDNDASWQFARACFDVADFSTNNAERADFAEQGIAACNRVIAKDPNSAVAHYYLGMNLGQLAQTRSLSALKL